MSILKPTASRRTTAARTLAHACGMAIGLLASLLSALASGAAAGTGGVPRALEPRQVDRATADEKLEQVDPYTRGQREELDRAGYVSLGPFPLAEGIGTGDAEETLGTPLLWVETAHFRVGSTLATYKCPSDGREQQKLRDELGRLAKKLPRIRRDPQKLDPWLRLHLYAQRLEEQYADFQARFGVRDEDFAPKAGPASGAAVSMGPGPYLGCEMKFTVLLTARRSQIARCARLWLKRDEATYYRALMPGGARFFGTSAEAAQGLGTEFDSALHVLVAGEVASNLCDGFRGARHDRPLWFRHGLGLWYGRRVDERWCLYVERVPTGSEVDSWRWEPRLHGLVTNAYVAKWDEMLAWEGGAQLEARQHMTAWSRVAWLLGQEKGDRRAFLMGLSEPLGPEVSDANRSAILLERQKQALQAGFGKTPGELDEAWRKWVLKKYPKR